MQELKERAGAIFGQYHRSISRGNRHLTDPEVQVVNDILVTLRAGQPTSCYLESPIKEGIDLLKDHFRAKFGLAKDANYATLLEYARDGNIFKGLNPTWESREPADVEFMAWTQLGVYDQALYPEDLEIP